MKLQQYLLNNYISIPFEEFSERAVAAIGILDTIKNNPMTMNTGKKEEQQEIDKAIEHVQKIIDETSPEIKISLFVLDRNILPQDQMKAGANYTTTFQYKTPYKGQGSIKMSQDQIQNYLCRALMEIHRILMRHIAGYSEQMFFETGQL